MMFAQDEAATESAVTSTTEALKKMDFQSLADLAQRDWGPMVTNYATGGVKVIIVMALTWIAAGYASRLMGHSLTKARVDETLTKFFAKMVRWTVLLFGILMCLSTFGVQTASFAAVIGAAGLAIGLAFQGSLSNFAAGVMLLIFRPFKVGQLINVAGVTGKVDEIELFTTTLDTFDNRRLILPNSSIFGATIENIGHHNDRRVDIKVSCAYSADLDETRQVLYQACDRIPLVLADPAPIVVLTDLADSSVDWSVRVWCNNGDYFSVREELLRSVKYALDEAGIQIPFPQMDIHLSNARIAQIHERAA
jgi:small conductance mechanosensitive channel